MEQVLQEHNDVVRKIAEIQKDRFEVLTNIDGEGNFISDVFPDLILVDKDSKEPIFIIEVKRNGQISSCLNQWKKVSNIPATLYLVVPEGDLTNAKYMATTLGLKAKFGTYSYVDNTVKFIKFES